MARFYVNRELRALPVNKKELKAVLVRMPTSEVRRYPNSEYLLMERRREQKRVVIEVKRLRDKRNELEVLKKELQWEIQSYKDKGVEVAFS